MQAELQALVERVGHASRRHAGLKLALAAVLGACIQAVPVIGAQTCHPGQSAGTTTCQGLDPTRAVLFAGDGAYRAFRATGDNTLVGDVPGFADRSPDGAGWGFQAWGSPDASPPSSHTGERLASMAVGASGREGWAVGPGLLDGQRLTLDHFDGNAWRRCDPASGDAACVDLADLRSRGLRLSGIATVDPDSSAFEAVAVGWLPEGATHPLASVILHYRDGHWSEEVAPADPTVGRTYQLTSVAFTGPDDGWAYGDSYLGPVILRFSDGRWSECSGKGTCDDGLGLLPGNQVSSPSQLSAPAYSPALVAAGDQVFLAGTRDLFLLSTHRHYPMVLSHRRGGQWQAGLDPGGPGKIPDPTQQRWITSFAAGPVSDGEAAGWARTRPDEGRVSGQSDQTVRLTPGGEWNAWSPTASEDALNDYPSGTEIQGMLPAQNRGAEGVMTTQGGPLLRFDAADARWRVLAAPFDPSGANPFTAGELLLTAADGRGGLWLAQDGGTNGTFFYEYSDHRPRPVFDDVPQPFAGGRIRQLAAASDGTLWLAGGGGEFARYDRILGWSTLRVTGWEVSAAVNAIAVAPGGTGVAVGDGGRIADLTPQGVQLDPATGIGRTLRAVAIAEDGSALAGGDGAELLWRPANTSFRPIAGPPIAASTSITALSLPTPARAWVATTAGEVFAGRQDAGHWSWDRAPENVGPDGRLLSAVDGGNGPQALRAIHIDAEGHGYAVGDNGVVLERTVAGWGRVPLGVHDDFTAVALPVGGGDAALIGGARGTIWTRAGAQFVPARAASAVDGYAAFGDTSVTGLALVPGTAPGQTEAWASLDGPALGGVLLHYSSDEHDPLLTPAKPTQALPDVPAPRPGELAFAAFGKSDCANPPGDPCPGPGGTDALSDIVSRRIDTAVRRAAGEPGGPRFAIFTGDASDHGGSIGQPSHPTLLNEWVDQVARPLDRSGVPVFGAVGKLDLASCTPANGNVCTGSVQSGESGTNIFWREAMADRVGQDNGPQSFGGLRYRPVLQDSLPSTPIPESAIHGPDPESSSPPIGGARTHYAVDILRADQPLARLVFVDNSLGSLRASDPLQQPPEPSGQLSWLDQVLSARPRGEPAVVVSTAPSYSYQPDTALDAASDGASFEQVVLKNRVSAVVSGHVGWNALYYTLAPGLHCPAPGGSYPEGPPDGTGDCGRGTGLFALVRDLAAVSGGREHAVPFLIASSAGGKLAQPSGTGYWHGYSIVRLDSSGDPAKTIVEQRPILDWLVITASTHELRPGQRTTLEGVGREPPAADTPPSYHHLSDPSITHRYDLLLADPHAPWMPETDGDGHYVSLADRYPGCAVGCVDRQSGVVRAGDGTTQPVYAIGMLSAGELTATYPLVFEAGTARPLAPTRSAGRELPVGGNLDPATATGSSAAPPSTGSAGPSPAGPSTPQSTSSFSTGISPASLADASHGRPTQPASPAPPPAPHSPATGQTPPARLVSSHVPRVFPVPPTPSLVHPAPQVLSRPAIDAQGAPPAALLTADEQDGLREPLWTVDLAQAPSMPRAAEATRRDPLPMTALRTNDQPSAWTRDALYGGGLVLAALVLAAGWLSAQSRHRARALPTRAIARSGRWHDC